MLIYVDLLLILNIWIDFLLLITTNMILKYQISYLKTLIASIIGGISTFILFIDNILIAFFLKIIICIGMQLIVNKYKSIKSLVENVFYFYLLSIILAGFLYLFKNQFNTERQNFLILIIITPVILFFSKKKIKDLDLYYKDRYDVILFYKGKNYLFNGFLDNGNKLVDPYRRRPIVLIYNRRIKYDEKDLILVPIETANGKSLLRCIRIDKLIIDGNIVKNVLVGLSSKPFKIKDINMILHKEIIGRK